MLCLADKVPTAAQKETLFKARLGLKNLKFDVNNDEEAVVKKITLIETENGSTQVIGFSQFRKCGGFELIRATANCRELIVLRDLGLCKRTEGYLRPIQKGLSTKPLTADKTSQVKREMH
jgi:hypothetical protein